MGSYGFSHEYQLEHPLKMSEDSKQCVVGMGIFTVEWAAGSCVFGGGMDVDLWMPAYSRLDDCHDCSQNWNTVSRPLGYETGYTLPCRPLWCWIIIYFDVEYSCSTPKGPAPLMIWWLNFLTSPVQDFTCAELNQTQWDDSMRACQEKSWGKGTHKGLLPDQPNRNVKEHEYVGTDMLCYIVMQINSWFAKIVQAII